MKEEIVDNDEIINTVNDIEEDRTFKDLKKEYPDKFEKLEDALRIYIGEKYLEILKTEFPEKGNYLTKKLAYPREYFITLDHYQKPVHKLKKEDLFSKLKDKCLDDEVMERTKQSFKLFDTKGGGELTQL